MSQPNALTSYYFYFRLDNHIAKDEIPEYLKLVFGKDVVSTAWTINYKYYQNGTKYKTTNTLVMLGFSKPTPLNAYGMDPKYTGINVICPLTFTKRETFLKMITGSNRIYLDDDSTSDWTPDELKSLSTLDLEDHQDRSDEESAYEVHRPLPRLAVSTDLPQWCAKVDQSLATPEDWYVNWLYDEFPRGSKSIQYIRSCSSAERAYVVIQPSSKCTLTTTLVTALNEGWNGRACVVTLDESSTTEEIYTEIELVKNGIFTSPKNKGRTVCLPYMPVVWVIADFMPPVDSPLRPRINVWKIKDGDLV
uniref:Uncharacterized protein n=1 Tax=viral metagenome TaxID=1070528 RepID=A0A6C0JS21_9ZZZZ